MIGGRLGPAVTLPQKMIASICHKCFMSKHHCHGVFEEGGVFIERLFCVPRVAFSCYRFIGETNVLKAKMAQARHTGFSRLTPCSDCRIALAWGSSCLLISESRNGFPRPRLLLIRV